MKMTINTTVQGKPEKMTHGRPRQVAGRRLRRDQADGACRRSEVGASADSDLGRSPCGRRRSRCPPAPSCCPRGSRLPGRRSCPSTGCRARRPGVAQLLEQARWPAVDSALRCEIGAGSGIVISPRSRSRGSARPRAPAPAPPAGATPALVAPPSMLTWMHTCSGGRSRGPLLGQALRRSSAGRRVCTQSKCSATSRVLLLWIGPMQCHSQRAGRPAAPIFSTPSWM